MSRQLANEACGPQDMSRHVANALEATVARSFALAALAASVGTRIGAQPA